MGNPLFPCLGSGLCRTVWWGHNTGRVGNRDSWSRKKIRDDEENKALLLSRSDVVTVGAVRACATNMSGKKAARDDCCGLQTRSSAVIVSAPSFAGC